MHRQPSPLVSVVCVFNDEWVRAECLDQSIRSASDRGLIQYIPVDNREGQHATAGAALNHGAGFAKAPVLILVHQDVCIHRLDPLLGAARMLAAEPGGFGMVGATGVTSDGDLVGRIRDRIALRGDPFTGVRIVDSVDELLFMVSTQAWRERRFTEDPALAWHAYGVEYSLYLQTRNLRTCVAQMPLSHNSLTTNIVGLDRAHARIADLYAPFLPIRTTCGQIQVRGPREAGRVRSHLRYRVNRLSNCFSTITRSVRRRQRVHYREAATGLELLLSGTSSEHVTVINLDTNSSRPDMSGHTFHFRGHVLEFTVTSWAGLFGAIESRHSERDPILVTNIPAAGLHEVNRILGVRNRWVGYDNTGYWLLARLG